MVCGRPPPNPSRLHRTPGPTHKLPPPTEGVAALSVGRMFHPVPRGVHRPNYWEPTLPAGLSTPGFGGGSVPHVERHPTPGTTPPLIAHIVGAWHTHIYRVLDRGRPRSAGRGKRGGKGHMVDGRGNAWRSRAPGPHAHRNTEGRVMDGLWTEARGRQKQSNNPGKNQHNLNTPTAGRH